MFLLQIQQDEQPSSSVGTVVSSADARFRHSKLRVGIVLLIRIFPCHNSVVSIRQR
jgi:hypothetical protein